MTSIFEFQFNNMIVEFDLSGEEMMINATEMGRIFGKEPYEFLRLETTKRYIEILKTSILEFRTGNIPVLNSGNAVSDDENVLRTERGKGKDGGSTWMHRQLALKFAAYLDPSFEVWVFRTIDTLIFDHARKTTEELKEKAKLTDRRDELTQKLQGNADFQEYRMIDFQLRQINNRIAKNNTSQLNLFRSN